MPVFSSLSLQYDTLKLGHRFREERQRRGVTLRALARQSGLSATRLSQIENARRTPDLSQAVAVAAALQIPLSAFFPPDRSIPYQICRDAEVRSRPPRTAPLVRRDGGRERHHNHFWPLADQFVDRQVEPLLGRIMPVRLEDARFCHHHDFEFVSVLNGTIEFLIQTPQGRQHEKLGRGDCLLFRSSVPHCMRSLEPEPADTLHILASTATPVQTAWDWFSPHAAAYLDEDGAGAAGSIGSALSLLRSARNWTLEEVANLVELKARQLEQIERGRRPIPVDKMIGLARVFGQPLHTFLGGNASEGPCYSLQRRADIARVPPRLRRHTDGPTGVGGLNTFHPLARGFPDRRVFPYLIRALNVDTAPLPRHEHHGHEFMYVLEGELELTISVEETTASETLYPGDSCYIDSSVPHVVRGRTRNPFSQASAEVIDVFWCPLGESYLFED